MFSLLRRSAQGSKRPNFH